MKLFWKLVFRKEKKNSSQWALSNRHIARERESVWSSKPRWGRACHCPCMHRNAAAGALLCPHAWDEKQKPCMPASLQLLVPWVLDLFASYLGCIASTHSLKFRNKTNKDLYMQVYKKYLLCSSICNFIPSTRVRTIVLLLYYTTSSKKKI